MEKKKFENALYNITGVMFAIILILLLGIALREEFRKEEPTLVPTATIITEPPKVLEDVIIEQPIETVTPTEEPLEIAQEEVVELEPISDPITFRVTAYCACEKCCGDWANDRPLDENGEPIVKGAAGKVLTPGVSVASPYPFGTKIELDGYGTVVVEDRTAKWVVDKYGENIVDIYFDDHQTAAEFALQYIEGRVLE